MARGSAVVVVGGGISGLAAAHALARSGRDMEVLVLEGSDVVGGKLRLDEVAGVPADVGAEALLNRRPEAVALARAVGLGADVCHPATTRAAIWTRGAVRPMPATVLGVPIDLRGLARSGIVSRLGVARAGVGSVLRRPPPSGDVSVAAYVSARWGHEVTERLVEPLIGGVYAGRAARLSLRAATPQIAAFAERREVPTTAPRVPVFAGIRGGVARLAQAVAATSGVTVRTSARVRDLVARDGWELTVGPTSDPELVTADAVVLATPATPTARLLASVCGEAARELRRIEYASMITVMLAVPAPSLSSAAGSGFLVPAVDRRAVKAVTFSWRKWAWVAQAAGEDVAILRASLGRHGDERLLQRDDEDLVALAVADLRAATGMRGDVIDARVTRWGGALPQYDVGHLDRVAGIRAAVARVPLLEVCGAAYDGVGVAACVADGQRAAEQLVAALPDRETMAP